MEFEKLTVPSHKGLFVKRLQEMILSGELEIGSRIPPERELAHQMGVSRTVVNGGINVLVSQGFLTVKPRQGTYVSDYKNEGNLDTLAAIMDLRGDVLKDKDVRSILEIRWAIEHLTMKNAIERATDEELEKIGKIVDSIKDAETPAEAAEISFAFQKELAIIGENPTLALVIASFRSPVLAMWQRFCRKYGIQVLYEHTLKSYNYLVNRDFEGAMAWLDYFIRDAIEGNFTLYED